MKNIFKKTKTKQQHWLVLEAVQELAQMSQFGQLIFAVVLVHLQIWKAKRWVQLRRRKRELGGFGEEHDSWGEKKKKKKKKKKTASVDD